ncbi:unnamed protein product [Camellia sinensis]
MPTIQPIEVLCFYKLPLFGVPRFYNLGVPLCRRIGWATFKFCTTFFLLFLLAMFMFIVCLILRCSYLICMFFVFVNVWRNYAYQLFDNMPD